MEKVRSASIERNTKGEAVAILTAGKRFPFKDGSFEMPEEIAETIQLADLTPDIIVDFADVDKHGLVFQSIRKEDDSSGEVAAWVRHISIDPQRTDGMRTYAQAVAALVKIREQSYKDARHLRTHSSTGVFVVGFVVKAGGTTVRGVLDNARKIAEEILLPVKELEKRVIDTSVDLSKMHENRTHNKRKEQ
jgi:hypothetical protein